MKGLISRYGDKGAHSHFKVTDATHSRPLERRIKKEYPQYGDMTVVFMNCLDQNDPRRNETIRGHLGRHPGTMRQVAEESTSASLRRMLTGLDDWRQDFIEYPRLDGEGNVLVVFICRKRRHRSVPARQLSHEAKDVLEEYSGARVAPLTRDVVATSL